MLFEKWRQTLLCFDVRSYFHESTQSWFTSSVASRHCHRDTHSGGYFNNRSDTMIVDFGHHRLISSVYCNYYFLFSNELQPLSPPWRRVVYFNSKRIWSKSFRWRSIILSFLCVCVLPGGFLVEFRAENVRDNCRTELKCMPLDCSWEWPFNSYLLTNTTLKLDLIKEQYFAIKTPAVVLWFTDYFRFCLRSRAFFRLATSSFKLNMGQSTIQANIVRIVARNWNAR